MIKIFSKIARSLCMVLLVAGTGFSTVSADSKDIEAVNQVLNAYHKAAGEGDWDTYFNQMAETSVFLGTDITERWTKKEFQAYAETRPTGWKYTPKKRNIDMTPDENAAFFDEILLSEQYGYSRGSGVLIRTKSGWKISQYNLTFPIPNDVFTEITKQFQGLVADQVKDN
ncbi:hypothetical protein GCM10017044_17610 [Kordiimonas sediminis]|uniref:SnoaL-like domain-containing protein n=1 Tax=Kordiimonas sediminis TaxID=1735581 RepID=A0A919E808_9PROT|nr:nuclear transport factor 2 family protein [Kordiimonas sediminis]GHF23545.1 hypothetical protein GCM10017044_17610 [Kordiimonas sediminis]